jgi:hypothetical protein
MPKRFIALDFYNEKTDQSDGSVFVAADSIEAVRPHWGGAHHDSDVWTHCSVHMRSGEVWPVNATLEQIEDAIDALTGIESASS